MDKVYLILSNGMVFEGRSFGASGDVTGELVFSTGMGGYIETLTDPSYAGQIILQTFPLIGNYGMIEEDIEGICAAHGYVVRECCETPSNFRCQYNLSQFLKEHNICGICGIDTRFITRIIREQGIMNARICPEIPAHMQPLQDYQAKNLISEVSTPDIQIYPSETGQTDYHVVLLDYGTKKSWIQALCRRGCQVTVYPFNATAGTILNQHPDGILLSNGPGNPSENTACIEQIQQLVGKIPLFGIGLGHQMLALAHGAKITALKYGHHGANHPVHEVKGNRTFITQQNHRYAVNAESLTSQGTAEVSFIHANDHTCAGLLYPDENCFSVQFYPDIYDGPGNTAFLFDHFIAMMGGMEHAQR